MTKAICKSTAPRRCRKNSSSGFDMITDIRDTPVWRSIFRSGRGDSNLHRSLRVQQNVFLHLASVKVRSKALEFGVTWYLGTLSLGCFLILVVTGILLMLYYHPSV